jgi:hypothetical protein
VFVIDKRYCENAEKYGNYRKNCIIAAELAAARTGVATEESVYANGWSVHCHRNDINPAGSSVKATAVPFVSDAIFAVTFKSR